MGHVGDELETPLQRRQQGVQPLQRPALRDRLGETPQRPVRGGRRGLAQEHPGRRRTGVVADHAVGLAGLDETLGDHLDLLDRLGADHQVGKVAEGIEVVDPGLDTRREYRPRQHLLGRRRPRGQAQPLQGVVDGFAVAVTGDVADLDEHRMRPPVQAKL
jgi:hypothetical protein